MFILHASSAFTALQKGTTAEDGVLTPLVAYVMHLIVAGQPMNAQRAPKRTLGTLGLTPSARILAQVRSLAHLALLRRAHANTENNAELISGVRYALGALPQFELVVLVVLYVQIADAEPGNGKSRARERAEKGEMEVDNSVDSGDEDASVCMGENVEDETRSILPSCAYGNNLNSRP